MTSRRDLREGDGYRGLSWMLRSLPLCAEVIHGLVEVYFSRKFGQHLGMPGILGMSLGDRVEVGMLELSDAAVSSAKDRLVPAPRHTFGTVLYRTPCLCFGLHPICWFWPLLPHHGTFRKMIKLHFVSNILA